MFVDSAAQVVVRRGTLLGAIGFSWAVIWVRVIEVRASPKLTR